MFRRELRLYANMLAYCRRLTADLDDSRLNVAASPGVNTPAWLLGHLAICTDYGLQLVGRPTHCSAAWHKQFGPGSKPDDLREPIPTKAELLSALENGHTRVTEAVRTANAEQMSEPHEIAFLQGMLPTKGDVLAHLLTTHEAGHLGQLSAWRRHMGLPTV